MPDAASPIELPPCELSKLEEISELFSSVLPSPIHREKLAVAIENDGYIKSLTDHSEHHKKEWSQTKKNGH